MAKRIIHQLNDTVDASQIDLAIDADHEPDIRSIIKPFQEIAEHLNVLKPKLAQCRAEDLQALKYAERDLSQKNEAALQQCVELKAQLTEQQAEVSMWKEIDKEAKNENLDLLKLIRERHDNISARYKFLLNKLDVTLRTKLDGAHFDLEFSHHDNKILIGYNSELDTFELCKMTPMVSTFDALKTLLHKSNDITGILSAWIFHCRNK